MTLEQSVWRNLEQKIILYFVLLKTRLDRININRIDFPGFRSWDPRCSLPSLDMIYEEGELSQTSIEMPRLGLAQLMIGITD